jgi:hypothetical protein
MSVKRARSSVRRISFIWVAVRRLTRSYRTWRLAAPLEGFLTDGASRTFHIGNQSILLKRTTPRNMATAGRISGLVIQALRHLKQAHVDDLAIATLRSRLTAEDKAVLLADAPLAPVWIGNVMRQIAQDKD